MPEEIVVIVVVAILAGTVSTIVKSVTGYLKSKNAAGTASGSSLTASELKTLLRSAVDEALEPLAARVERIERRLEGGEAEMPLLDEPRDELLDEIDAGAEEDAGPVRAGQRRVRS